MVIGLTAEAGGCARPNHGLTTVLTLSRTMSVTAGVSQWFHDRGHLVHNHIRDHWRQPLSLPTSFVQCSVG